MGFDLLLIIILLALGTVNSLFLIIKKDEGYLPNTMFGWSLLFYNIFILSYFLWFEAAYVLEVPHLLRSVSPLMYLGAPFFYFFIRNVLFDLKGFQKYDWVHFLPVVFHFLELIPFYLESQEVKYAIAEIIVESPNQRNYIGHGLIPVSFHYTLRIILQTGYFFYCIYLIYKVKPSFLTRIDSEKMRNWLFITVFFMGWVVISNLIYAILVNLSNLTDADFSLLLTYTVNISLLGILLLNLYINFKPELVYRYDPREDFGENGILNEEETLPEESVNKSSVENEIILNTLVDDSQNIDKDQLQLIRTVLETDQLFLEKNVNIKVLAEKISLPLKTTSHLFKTEYGKGFNEVANEYRILQAIKQIEEGYLDQYTLESLGSEVGFNSRTTFFNAFKKHQNCSPTEYWKNFQNMD